MLEMLKKLFSGENQKRKIAEMLKTNPEALEAFEKAYSVILEETPENESDMNSRQAAAQRASSVSSVDNEYLTELKRRIVDELVSLTKVYVYDGQEGSSKAVKCLPAGTAPVTSKDISIVPEPLRPELAGDLIKRDLGESYPGLMMYLDMMTKAKASSVRMDAYHHFRQGLDILDLDAITYEMLGMNQNSIGHWFPQLVEACKTQDFFKLPKTTIAKVPCTLLQLTRLEYASHTPTTMDIVNAWAKEVFCLKEEEEYFIKTGVYSSKFDFRNCHVYGGKEVNELGEYLLYIHYQACQLASPLNIPCIYGPGTTNEWVVREFIHDVEGNPCIYKGLPLHTEYRVFIDCDTQEVLGISPYWEPETMKERFSNGPDADDPHMKHDFVIYLHHEETLMRRYHENADMVKEKVAELLPNLNLTGQWSLDVMQNGDDFWLIDMAVAENSAFYADSVPEEKRRPRVENWIPELSEKGGFHFE